VESHVVIVLEFIYLFVFVFKENEIFQQTLKTTQRKLLKASRDKNILLDRLIQYESVELSSSDDELTESSDEGDSIKPEPKK